MTNNEIKQQDGPTCTQDVSGGDCGAAPVRLWGIDDDKLTDEQLAQIITENYAPSVIPPCRVCGADLSIGASGGGQPTRWYCSAASDAQPMDWDHYGKSLWEDRRQGGDSRVMELLRRYKSNRPKGEARADNASPPHQKGN